MTEQTEREALEALARRVWGWCEAPAGVDPYEWAYRWARLSRLLDVKAYLDAALMLVPEGWAYILDTTGLFSSVSLWNGQHCVIGEYFDGVSIKRSTPALALCAAIEAAIAREGE